MADTSLFPFRTPPRDAPLRITPVFMQPAPQQPEQLTLRATDGEVGPLRVKADPGVELICPGETTGKSECRIAALADQAAAVISVTVTAPLLATDAVRIRIWWGTRFALVMVAAVDPTQRVLASSGRYSGVAHLISEGTVVRADGGLVAPARSTALAIDATLTANAQGFVIDAQDPSRLFQASGRWTGQLFNTGGSAAFPRVRVLDERIASGTDVEVLQQQNVRWQDNNAGTLTLEVENVFVGISDVARSPRALWRVVLNRVGSPLADAGTPTIPADVAPRLSAARSSTPTPWEAALGTAVPALTTSGLAAQTAAIAAMARANLPDGGPIPLEACGRSRSETDLLAQRVFFDSFSGSGGTRTYRFASTVAQPAAFETRLQGAEVPFQFPFDGPLFQSLVTASFDLFLLPLGVANHEITLRLFDPLSSDPQNRQAVFARGIPCDLNFPGGSYTATRPSSVGGGTISVPLASYASLGDVYCTRMRNETGCEVQTLTTAERYGFTFEAAFAFESTAGGQYTGTARPTVNVLKVCRLPRTPAVCGEAISCAEPTGTTASTYVSSRLGPTLQPVTRDPTCLAGPNALGLEFDENLNLPTGAAQRATSAAMARACMADWADLKGASIPAGAAQYGTTLQVLFDASNRCLDGPRFLMAAGASATAPEWTSTNPLERRRQVHLHRLLQRWAQVTTFLARDAAQRDGMADVFRGVAGAPPDSVGTLTQLRGNWNLFFHPRFAEAIEALPADVLRNPDARRLIPGAPAALLTDEQNVPLAVSVLEGLEAQVELAQLIIERAHRQNQQVAVGPVLQSMAVIPLLRAQARAMVAKAESSPGGQVTWRSRFDLADAQLFAKVAQLGASVRRLQRGENPLGIEEADVPLYFLGNEMSASSRFSAVSDYLLGVPGNQTAWAPSLVNQATQSLIAAQTAWLGQQDRQLQVSLSTTSQADRERAVKEEAGTAVLSLCGNIPGLQPETVLDNAATINAQTCFIKRELPECRPNESDYLKLIKKDDIEYQLCLIGKARNVVGPSVGLRDPLFDFFSRGCTASSYQPTGCTTGTTGACFTCTIEGIARVAPMTPTSVSALVVDPDNDVKRALFNARSECQVRFPLASRSPPSLSDLRRTALESPACYRGSLGEASLALQSLSRQVEIARAVVNERGEAYDIAMRSCIILQQNNAKVQAATVAQDALVGSIKGLALAASASAHAVGAVKDCGLAVSGDWNGASTLIGCSTAPIEAALAVASEAFTLVAEETDRQFNNVKAQMEDDAEERICVNDASIELVGVKSATLALQAAVVDMKAGLERLNTQKQLVADALEAGRAKLARVQGQSTPVPEFDYWVASDIARFQSKMKLARRVTYLAVRAVEYETQASLVSRTAVLRAGTPQELADVIDDLWRNVGTRSVGSSRPSDLKVVISLKRSLLQIGTQVGRATTQGLSDTQRFQLLLTSPRYAVFDEQNRYTGQRIPFSLMPLGIIGDPQGIPLLSAANSCAERVWNVNASILGANLLQGQDMPTFTLMELQKSNTFSSQRCGSGPRGLQTASVRPSVNLFREPELAVSVSTPQGGTPEQALFTRARIQAYFNVSRADFERDSYANGQTAELAARGLYGDYALFFPAEVLSVWNSTMSTRSDGLKLDQVDDVLLRLDYVSVAR